MEALSSQPAAALRLDLRCAAGANRLIFSSSALDKNGSSGTCPTWGLHEWIFKSFNALCVIPVDSRPGRPSRSKRWELGFGHKFGGYSRRRGLLRESA